jgi:hypothetical protein
MAQPECALFTAFKQFVAQYRIVGLAAYSKYIGFLLLFVVHKIMDLLAFSLLVVDQSVVNRLKESESES